MSIGQQPFFAVPGYTRTRRLLLLTYHFPPASSAGALRWQKLAQIASKDYGWQLDVVTLDPSSIASPDYSQLAGLPSGTRVFGVSERRLLIDDIEGVVWRWYKALGSLLHRGTSDAEHGTSRSQSPKTQSLARSEAIRWRIRWRHLVRAYYAFLLRLRDGRWAKNATEVAFNIARCEKYGAVISCGPPHWVHKEASRLAERLAVPHVIDMRDPWSQVERLPEIMASPVWYRLAKRAEAWSIVRASLVVCNTARARESLVDLYPGIADRCITVMNGFDDDPLPTPHDDGRFVIAYAGTIYLDRNPRCLFRGASMAVSRLGLTPSDFGLEFMGSVAAYDGVGIQTIAAEFGLEDYVHVRPAGKRQAAMDFLAGASMVVSLPQDSVTAIPSKVFEYMRLNAWLLAITERESATHEVLRGTSADVVAPGDAELIATTICSRYAEYRARGRPDQPAMNVLCSRRMQGQILFDALSRLTDGDEMIRYELASPANVAF